MTIVSFLRIKFIRESICFHVSIVFDSFSLKATSEKYDLVRSQMDTAVSDREAMLPVRRQYEADVLKLEKWNKAATTLCQAPLELEASIQELQLELKKHQVRIYNLFTFCCFYTATLICYRS